MTAAQPVRISATTDTSIGTTAFFRNRAFLEQLGCEAERLGASSQPVRILAHACSIGAEVYSLAIHLLLRHPDVDFILHATDVSDEFREIAETGIYDSDYLSALEADETAFFEPIGDGQVSVSGEARARVEFLPAASFVDFDARVTYDIVTVCNALVYVSAEEQARTIDQIAAYNSGVLAVTASHRQSIAEDLARNGYRPVMGRFLDIHAGWVDRHRPPEGSTRLSPLVKTDPWIDEIESGYGWRYRHGSIFVKSKDGAAACLGGGDAPPAGLLSVPALSPEFDQPPWVGPPARSFIIATVQFSGSEEVCRALRSYGGFGAPHEYLKSTAQNRDWLARLGIQEAQPDTAAYLAALTARRTTQNGVFGIAIFASQMAAALKSDALKQALPNARFVRLVRRNVFAQAAALSVARQTGNWASPGDCRDASYDYQSMSGCLNVILTARAAWDNFVSSCGLAAPTLVLEDFLADPATALHLVAAAIDLDIGETDWPMTPEDPIGESNTIREWVARYCDEREALDPSFKTPSFALAA